TFDWHSVMPSTLKRMPKSETSVLLTTVIITVATGNLAFGIAGGVLLAMVLFARRVAHVIRVERMPSEDGDTVRYAVHGPLFFGSSNDLVAALLRNAPFPQAQLAGHGGPVRSIAISADGNTVLSGSFDTAAIRWSLAGGSAEQVLRFHADAVNAVAFLKGGRMATAGADAKI